MRCRSGGHAGSARVAVFFLRHNEAASKLAASSLLCRRKACRQSRATKGVGHAFGNSFTPLEPGTTKRAAAGPPDVSEESRSNARGSAALEPVSFPEWPPPYRGPLGFPHLHSLTLESFTSERAAARPALTSPKRAAVMREAPAALEPVSVPKWPPPHRGPLGLPHSASGRGASSITLYAVDGATSLKIVRASLVDSYPCIWHTFDANALKLTG